MNAAKWIVALGLLISGPVVAGEKVYDYQGRVMTGLGEPETLTAQIELLGPLNNLDTTANISMSFSGTYSGLYASDNCIIAACATPGEPLELQINERHGKFVSAYLSFATIFSNVGSFYEGSLVIGPKGDSFDLTTLFGPNVVSVANSTPGAWTEAHVGKAPELNANSALAAMTLLAGSLLIRTGKRRYG